MTFSELPIGQVFYFTECNNLMFRVKIGPKELRTKIGVASYSVLSSESMTGGMSYTSKIVLGFPVNTLEVLGERY